MADWDKMALMHILVGYEAQILGIVTYQNYDPDYKWSHTIQSLLIVAFVLYTIGASMLAATKLSGAVVNLFMSITIIICMLVTGVFLVIGVGLYDWYNNAIPYSATLLMSAAALAFLSLVFISVHLCTHGTRSVSNGPTTRA